MLLTREQLAKELQVSKRKIFRLEKEGLPMIRLGDNSPRYDLDTVMAWIQDKNDIVRNIN